MTALPLPEDRPPADVAELAARRASTWTDPAGPILGTPELARLGVGSVVEMIESGRAEVARYEIVAWTDEDGGYPIRVARRLGHHRHEAPADAVEAGRALVHGVTVVGRLIRRA